MSKSGPWFVSKGVIAFGHFCGFVEVRMSVPSADVQCVIDGTRELGVPVVQPCVAEVRSIDEVRGGVMPACEEVEAPPPATIAEARDACEEETQTPTTTGLETREAVPSAGAELEVEPAVATDHSTHEFVSSVGAEAAEVDVTEPALSLDQPETATQSCAQEVEPTPATSHTADAVEAEVHPSAASVELAGDRDAKELGVSISTEADSGATRPSAKTDPTTPHEVETHESPDNLEDAPLSTTSDEMADQGMPDSKVEELKPADHLTHWLGCDRCGVWYKSDLESYRRWQSRPFECSLLGLVCQHRAKSQRLMKRPASCAGPVRSVKQKLPVMSQLAEKQAESADVLVDNWVGCDICPKWYKVSAATLNEYKDSHFECQLLGKRCRVKRGQQGAPSRVRQ